jgi:hypothetical protein
VALYTMRTAFERLLHVWSNRLWLALRFGSEDLEVAHLPRPLEECRANEWQLTPDALDPSMLCRMAALGQQYALELRWCDGRIAPIPAVRRAGIQRQRSSEAV